MKNEKTFKTKTGYCHILQDKIVLTKEKIISDISKIPKGNGVFRVLIIYSILTLILLYNSFTNYKSGDTIPALFFGLLATFLLYGIVKSINNSATPVIERNKIKDVTFFNAKPGLTRARFEIMFEDDHGNIKKRLILLPGSLNDGQNETDKALEVMKNEGLLQ